MKRHISIFAFLLGAFAATTQAANTQLVNGGYYFVENEYRMIDVNRMRLKGSTSKKTIELAENEKATFVAYPEKGLQVAQWGTLLTTQGEDAKKYLKYTWSDTKSTEKEWIGNPAGANGYIAVNFKYIPFDITFDGNGGTGEMEPITGLNIISNAIKLTSCAFTRTGYEMVGWSNAVYWAAHQTAISDGATVKGEDFWDDTKGEFGEKNKVMLFALWKTNTYSIAYDANGGTISKPGPASADFGEIFEVVHPAKAGSQFKGWKVVEGLDPKTAKWGSTATSVSSSISDADTLCKGNGASTFFLNISAAKNGAVKLQAVWSADGYTVTFDNQGADSGRGGISSMTVEYGALPANLKASEIPFKTGFDFDGYFEGKNGTGEQQWNKCGAYQFPDGWPYTWGMTLYASWNAHHYSLSYDGLEDATGYPTSAAYGETFALARPAKTGYKFAGWNVTAGLASKDAKWSESEDHVDNSITYSWTDIKPSDKNPTGTVYIKNLNTNDNAQVTLKANWVEVKYKATFEIAGANNNPTKEVEVTYDGELPKVTTVPTYESGEIFRGYFTEPNGRGEKYWNADGTPAKEKWTVAGDLKLYECKTGFDYYITYDANGGEGSVPKQSCNSSNDVTLASGEELHRSGFRLCGWDFNKDISPEKCAFHPSQVVSFTDLGVKVEHGTAALFAIWQDKHVRIAIDATGGTACTNGVKVTSLTYVDGEKYGFLPTAEKPHYVFAGWFTQAEGGERILEDSIVDYESVKTLYAQWTPERYFVAFDGNGATNADDMAVQEFAWDEEKALSRNLYGRTGYTFDGWATNTVTMKKVFDDCQVVSNLVETADATQTVFAVWHTNSYTVVFNGNGATSGSMEPQDFLYDRPQELLANGFTRGELWSFAGWTNSIPGGSFYTNRETVINLCAEDGGTVTLDAVWHSELSELSIAMDCRNLIWTSEKVRFVETDAWIVCTTNGLDGTCAELVPEAETYYMSANVSTNGTLTFKWQPSSESSILWIEKEIDGGKTHTNVTGIVGEWTEVKIEVPPFPYGVASARVSIALWKGTGPCYVDQMTWSPEGSHPEPKEKDRVKISSAAVSDGKFVLSFEFNEDFDYLLKTNADLLIDSWGVMEVEGKKTDNILTFEPQIIEGQPQLFYKVDTIKKE